MNSRDPKPRVGIIMGDPAGIGPEITIKSFIWPEIHSLCTPVVIGDARIVRIALQGERKALPIHTLQRINQV